MNTTEQRAAPEIGDVELVRRVTAGDDAGFDLLVTAETAEVLDISTASVKTRLHRARAALKRLLDPVTGVSRE